MKHREVTFIHGTASLLESFAHVYMPQGRRIKKHEESFG